MIRMWTEFVSPWIRFIELTEHGEGVHLRQLPPLLVWTRNSLYRIFRAQSGRPKLRQRRREIRRSGCIAAVETLNPRAAAEVPPNAACSDRIGRDQLGVASSTSQAASAPRRRRRTVRSE